MNVVEPEQQLEIESKVLNFLSTSPEPAQTKAVYEALGTYPKYKIGFVIEMLIFTGKITSDARFGTLSVTTEGR